MCSILVTSLSSNSIPSPQLTLLLHSLELNLRPPLLFSWNFVEEVVFHLNILMLTSISSLSLSFYQYNSIFTPGCLLPSGCKQVSDIVDKVSLIGSSVTLITIPPQVSLSPGSGSDVTPAGVGAAVRGLRPEPGGGGTTQIWATSEFPNVHKWFLNVWGEHNYSRLQTMLQAFVSLVLCTSVLMRVSHIWLVWSRSDFTTENHLISAIHWRNKPH